MFEGLLQVGAWERVIAVLVFTHLTIIGVTVYLHRHQAHRALDLHPAVAHFFRFWLWLTTGMVTREWVAVHRRHHARCETPEDPHSPRQLGIRKVLLEGSELYRDGVRDREQVSRYAHGTPDDWIERNLYQRWNFLGVSLMLVLNVVLFGLWGITMWAVQMLWIPVFAAGVINGLGHWWGYRNFESPDGSTNILPWGVLIGGEELHNNHHAYASSAKLSSRPWEFDVGWLYIRLLAAVRLARVRRLPPKTYQVPGKAWVDVDTVSAVISDRLSIMSRYAQIVVGRVYRDEVARADAAYRRLLQRGRSVLVREDSLLTDEGRQRLDRILQASPTLKTVYEFRQRLQQLWMERSASQERLLAGLQEWCRQAEETGIRELQEFARGLRSYSLQPA